MDPRVIDIAGWKRWLLVNLVIAPFRTPKSARAYETIWTNKGSPLLLHGQNLRDATSRLLGDKYRVVLGMRYGAPSLQSSLSALQSAGCRQIIAVPLFPQYAEATTGSCIARLTELTGEIDAGLELHITRPFYNHAGFIDAMAAPAKATIDAFRPDFVLLSYHGLPRSQLQSACPNTDQCLNPVGPCSAETTSDEQSIGPLGTERCYRQQCFATSRLLAKRLQLDSGQHATSFQSRLGGAEWIRPYTDDALSKLAARGVRRLAIATPAFVADCLETLEELGDRARQTWLDLGGEDLAVIPCPNSGPIFAAMIASLIRSQ